MRKLTLLISMLFLSLGMAWAQSSEAKVTDLNDLSNEKIYFIESQRAFLMYNTTASANGISASTSTTVTPARELSNYNNWFSIKTEGGNRYLYSIGAGKYITKDGTFSDTPVDALGIKPAKSENRVDTNNYNWMLTIGGNGLNSQDPGQTSSGILVNWWTHNDPGNCYRIIDVESVLPFELCSSYDEITNWYKLGIRDDNLGPSFLKYDAAKQYIPTPSSYNESEKEAFAWAFVVTPGTGISIVNKAAGDEKVLSAPVAPTGDKNSAQLARMVEKNGAAGNIVWDIIIPTTHGSTKEFSFYVQHPTAKNYAFNRQNINGENVLCYWTGRDTGSSIWTEGIQGDAVVLKNLVSELNALFASKPKGDAVGQYSSSYANYESEFNRISGYASTLADNAIGANIREDIAILNAIKESYSINMPVSGKYYTFSNSDKYITSKVVSDRIACGANDAYAIYYFDGSRLKSFATGQYIGLNINDWTFSGSGSAIQFVAAANGAVGKFNINSGERWLHLTVNTDGTAFVNRCSNNTCGDAHNWVIEEVTDLPVAQSGNTVYYSLADAKANVKAGETLTLFVDTDETIELPLGVILDRNGHTANNVTVATPVAKIGDQGYATLAAAVKAASAGATITFVDNIKESVTFSKNVTIDGANFNYTGTMSANNALTVTVQNVNFVNGGFAKNNSGTTGTYTVKDCTFDGKGTYAYPVLASNIGTLNVVNCTVKDYQYGFLYVKKQSTKVSVKNVTVEGCANYAVYLASGVNTATFEELTVKNSNNGILWPSAGARTLNLKNCKFEGVKTAINSNGGAYVVTANVQGVNDFGTAVLSNNVKCVLAEDATLAATTAGLNVTTNVEGKEVAYQGGVYSVVVKRDPAGHVAYRADVTDKADREGIAILLKEVYAKNSLVVKVYNGETLMFTCTRLGIDDEGKVMFPVDGNTTANIVLWGKPSGSWNNEIHVAPTELNVPDRVEIWADDVLVQNYTHESQTILGTNLEKYLALECVKKFDAKIGNAGYETLAAAIENAQAGETIVLLRDITASDIITINKAITLDGNGKTLTSTATRAINVETEGNVGIENLTINAGERAINIINFPANVTVNNVTATAKNNAVMMATSATGAKLTVNNSDFTGLAVVNVASAGSEVEINNTNITNVDANEGENYGAISIFKTASNATVVVNGGEVVVAGDSKAASIGAAGATVTFNATEGNTEVQTIVAYIGDAGYTTLKEAVEDAEAGATVVLLDDATGAGVVINKNLTIDFGGKTYTVNQTVGSTGTTTLGLQILKDNAVTLKNGTLTSTAAVEGSKEVKMLVQNYANLTVDNMQLVDDTEHILYVLSNNSGTVNIVNGSVISSDAVALDACKYASYTAPTVNVAEGVTVKGKVEVSATLNMNGTLDGTIVINGAEGTVNGAEGLNVTAMDGYKVAYADGAHTIVKKHYVAEVGGVQYETFAAAVAAAPAGGTVTLIADATEAATVVLTKNLTIDGADKTFTGAIEFKKSNGSFTVKNVKFNGAGNRVYALKSQASVTSLTVENCEATGYTYGFLYANKSIANVTVTDVTVKDVTYGVHSAYGTNVTLNSFVAENVKYGVMVQNYGTRNVVLNNCSFTDSENPLYIWERNQTNKITFNFEGANEMGKDDFCTSTMAVVNAEAVAGTKVCGTLAEAVEAAQAGEKVTLLGNAQLSTFLTINKSITLNMGEYNITRDGGTALYVNGDGAQVVINGTGKVTGSQALFVNKGLVKVNGGHFYGTSSNAEAVYVKGYGVVEIYGGTFEGDTNAQYYYVLNKLDADRATSSITVYGGTFVGFNPADNAAEGQGTNFVAAGLMAVDNGDGTYGIAEANIKMGDSYYATLAEAIAAIGAGDVVIELLADATLDYNAREAYGTAETTSVTINGNGNTLTLNQTNSDWSSFGLAAGKVVLNNMTIDKTGHGDTNGAWNKHAIIFSSPVEMNGVTVNNSVAVQDGATLNNVTINEAGEYYGLWINGNGQTVTVNGGAINATNAGRGIKIADQYIDAPAQVILNVTDTKFTTAKKAAVLVSSKAGAKITAANVNIENVVADKVNFVWVDEDWSQYFAEVEVTGATKAQEGLENLVAQRSNGASYKTLAEAVAAAAAGETITLIGNTEEDVTVSKNLTIEGAGMQYTGIMTLNKVNVTVQNLNFVKGQISKSKNNNGGNVTIVDCNFDGQGMNSYAVNVARTGSVVIENVTAQNYGYGFLQLSHSNNKLSIKDVKVMNTNYALKIDYSNGVTIDGLKVENVAIAAIYNSNYGTKTYTITNSDFSGAAEAIKMWERNTTVYDTFVFAGGNTLGDATLSTSPYAIYKGVVAEVGAKKFLDLRVAFDAALDGETVKMLDNVTLDTKTLATQNDGYAAIINVADKAVTLDLNGKNITVEAAAADLASAKGGMLLGVFSADLGGHLTFTDNSDVKNGAVTVNLNDAKIYSVFVSESSQSDKSNSGKITVNGGNYTTVGKVSNAMFFTDANEVITVNGGNFHCDGATTTTSYPWMFNTYGNNELHVTVNGGTFNVDINHQHRPFEVKVPETSAVNANGGGTWTVVPAEAYITEMLGATVNEAGEWPHKVGYATLAAAVEAAQDGETVTLLKDVTGAGLVINKDVTIDFDGHIYTVNKAVGSKGTETLGLQILKENDVTLQNGTLTSTAAVEGSNEIKMLVQNYADLTVHNMNLVDATGHILYVLSNNSGETYLTGITNITTDAVAFDSYYSKHYDAPTVYVETEGRIEGAIEKNVGATIAISSGTFTEKILPDWCAEYYVPVQNAEGEWTVEYRYIDELTIVDDGKYTYDFVKDMTVGEFTYKRTLPAVYMWQTAYFPFEIPVEVLAEKGYEVGYFYDIHFEFNDGEINMENAPELHFLKINSGTLRANYPYLIRPTAEADLNLVLEFEDIVLHSVNDVTTVESSSTVHTFEFAGLYKRTLCSEYAGDAPCYTVTTKGECKKIAKTANLPSFRVYMTIKAKDGSPVIIDETNAPEYIKMRVIGEENEDGTTTIYDVNAEEAEEMIFDLSGRRVLETEKGIYIKNGKKVYVK